MDARVRSISALTGIFLIASTAAAGQASLGLGASVSMADPEAPQEILVEGAKQSREVEDRKVVCKGETRANSRFKDKVCMTRAEWNQLREQQIRDAREWIDRPVVNGQRGG